MLGLHKAEVGVSVRQPLVKLIYGKSSSTMSTDLYCVELWHLVIVVVVLIGYYIYSKVKLYLL